MATYFLVHERAFLEDGLRPALTAAWQRRSFAPCLALCRQWRDAALDYAAAAAVKTDDLLLLRIDAIDFDRALWRALVGELLLVAACAMPEFPTRLETLGWLLAGEPGPADLADRPRLHPLHQALVGSKDLRF